MRKLFSILIVLMIAGCTARGPICPEPLDGGIGGTGIEAECEN